MRPAGEFTEKTKARFNRSEAIVCLRVYCTYGHACNIDDAIYAAERYARIVVCMQEGRTSKSPPCLVKRLSGFAPTKPLRASLAGLALYKITVAFSITYENAGKQKSPRTRMRGVFCQ